MVHGHFEEHKNQLFAGKKLKIMVDSPRARKKIGLKCSLGECDTTVQFAEKYHSEFRFAHLYCGMLPTGRTSLMLSTTSRFLLHQHLHLLSW